jgi:hypothetical protein
MSMQSIVLIRFANGKIVETKIRHTVGTVEEDSFGRITIKLPAVPSGYILVQGIDDGEDFHMGNSPKEPTKPRGD